RSSDHDRGDGRREAENARVRSCHARRRRHGRHGLLSPDCPSKRRLRRVVCVPCVMYPSRIEPRFRARFFLSIQGVLILLAFGTLNTAIRFLPKLNVPINVPVNSRFRPLVAAIFHLPVLVSLLPFFAFEAA